MEYSGPARAEARRAPEMVLVVLAVVIAAIIGTLGYQSASPPTTPFGDVPHVHDHVAAPANSAATTPTSGPTPLSIVTSRAPGRNRAALGEADGLVPDGASVFDDETPAVANLDPSLLKALRRAATDAATHGVEFQVKSGWRSPKYQEQLLREAISVYGSEEEAARWVATANTSPHVSGDAVDIGPAAATAWLAKHGARYGLCQIYRNEPWHYELRPEATSRGCPPMYADPTRDPRMQR